jgi:transcriptional regulator GlxA family with amidase domain
MVVVIGNVDKMLSADGEDRETDDQHERTLVRWLRSTVTPSHMLVCICSGAIPAGLAGLLDGYSCTTHYSCCAELSKAAPKARVQENRLYLQDGNRYTSAGVTAGIDLMLYVVARLTTDSCVAAIARYLVVYLRRNGTDPQRSPWLEGRNHVHPGIHRAQDAIASHPAEPWTPDKIARIAGVSSRHLSRLFHEYTSFGIVDYRNSLRVALAHELVSQTNLDIEQVAQRVGFNSSRQLRRAWRRVYPCSPREMRLQNSQRATCG